MSRNLLSQQPSVRPVLRREDAGLQLPQRVAVERRVQPRLAEPRQAIRRDAARKHWCITINNPLDTDAEYCARIASESQRIHYFVFQRERGDEGTVHLQCYMETVNRVRFTALLAWPCFDMHPHIEARRGTRQEARDYCFKSDTRMEGHGTVCPVPINLL